MRVRVLEGVRLRAGSWSSACSAVAQAVAVYCVADEGERALVRFGVGLRCAPLTTAGILRGREESVAAEYTATLCTRGSRLRRARIQGFRVISRW